MLDRILVPLDMSLLAEQAIVTAASLASACGAELEFVLVHTGAEYGALAHGTFAGATEEAIYINSLANEVGSRFGIRATATVVRGIPVEAIVRRIVASRADMVVMTSHGRTGFSRVWLGSVADGVIRQSSVPVLVLRPSNHRSWRTSLPKTFRRVLIPTDGGEVSASLFESALDLCRKLGATPVLARVVIPATIDFSGTGDILAPNIVDSEATDRLILDAAAELEAAAASARQRGMRCETVVEVSDRIAAKLIEIAKMRRVDLIAIATHSRGASRLLLGSISDKLLRGCDLPIMALHPVAPGVTSTLLPELQHSA